MTQPSHTGLEHILQPRALEPLVCWGSEHNSWLVGFGFSYASLSCTSASTSRRGKATLAGLSKPMASRGVYR